MLKIGITGGIGSGKSLITRIFNHFGIPIFNADEAAKELMHTDARLQQTLKDTFGSNIYVDGILDRAALSAIVFNNTTQLALLNSIVHPRVIEYGNEWHNRQIAPYTLKEAALLFESGSYKELDYVIGVYAPLEIRIARTIKRDNSTRQQALDRISKQLNEEEKMQKCKWVITNDYTHSLLQQVTHIHSEILKLNH